MAFDQHSQSPMPAPPLFSTFAGDGEMAELIEFFTSELSNRISALEAAWAETDVETLARLTHQLKGAAAGYGYPSITDAASSYEAALKSASAASLPELSSMHGAFIDLLDRARAGGAPQQQRDAA